MLGLRRNSVVLLTLWCLGLAACADVEPDAGRNADVGLNTQALTGNPPVNSLPPPQTTNEDSQLTFSELGGNAITVSDLDNMTSTVQITVANGVFFLGPVVNGIVVSGNGTSSVILSGPIVVLNPTTAVIIGGINKALDVAHYNPAANFNGPTTLQMNSSDTNGDVGFNVLDVTVTSFNDSPVNNVPVGTQAATEDVPRSFTISVNDVDVGNAPMVLTLASTNGTLITLPTLTGLSFTSGDGTADSTLSFSGTLTDISAALNGLTVTPSANYAGSSTLQITSEDQGASGAGAPGSDSDTVNIDWAAVNDSPVNGVPGAQATVEELPVTFSAGNGNQLSVNDNDGPTTLVQVTLSTTGGTITLGAPGGVSFTAGDGTSDATMTFRATLSSLNSALASTVFTPSANFAGTAVLTMISNDLGNSGSGGARQDTDTVDITVSGINDPPINSVPAAQATSEDVVEVFSSGNGNAIGFADADAPTLQVTLTALNGTLTLATLSGLTFQAGDGSGDGVVTFTGTIAQVNAAVNGLQFKPSSNFNGGAKLTVLTSDRGATGSGGTLTDTDEIAIDVLVGNDPPDAVNDTLTLAEDSAPADVQVLANDTSLPDVGEPLTIVGVSTPLHGTASTNGSVATYQPAANYAGADSFTYTISDGHGGTDTATVAVTVTNVNDAPSAVTDSFTVLQNTPASLNVLSNDSAAPDSGETLTVTAVSAAGNGTPAIANGGAAVSYTPNSGFSGADSFTYTISDGNGGTAIATVNISVQAVNTTPVNTLPGPQTVSEDSQLLFSSAAGNPITVADSNNPTLTVQISVTNGTFTLGATAGLTVTNNGSASVSAQGTIAALNSGFNNAHYAPTANYSGAASLTLNSADSNGESDLDVLTLTVSALNDAPINSVPAGVQAATEDVPKTFGSISISDSDVGSGQLLVTLTADNGTLVTLSSTAGLSFSAGDGASDPTMSFSGALSSINAALNGVTVTAASNFIGTSTLTLTTSDQGNTGGGGAGQDVDGINISWVSVNDPPVNTVPGAQATDEEAPLTFSTGNGNVLRVSDLDVSAGLLQVTLSASTGTLTLSNPGAVSFSSGDGTADSSMTFTGTLASINGALDGAVYTPVANFTGAATLTLLTSDLGNSGSGGTRTDSDTVAITVAGTNDAPVNAVPGMQVTNEDVVRVFSIANANGISVSDVDAASLQLTLSASSGSLSLPLKTGLTFQAGDGTADPSMTFTGTIASINAALNGLSFTPAANFFGAATLTVLTSDLGASGVGGTRVDEDTIAISVSAVNDPPDAINDTLTIDEDSPATNVFVLANDSALPDLGETLDLTAVSTPAHGTASINGNSIAYTPAANYRGSDTFTYTISDGHGAEDSASVAVTVLSVNDSPTAADDSFSVLQNSGATGLGVLSNDSSAPDTGETLSIIGVTTPANGAATITGGGTGLSYTPNAAFTGADSFTYTISDGNGGTSSATVAMTVTAVNTKPVNTLPLPQTTSEDVPLIFSNANGNPISVTDSNNTTLTVQVSVTNGIFTLGGIAGLTVFGNATASVTIQGTIAALNNTGLNGARYTPSANYNGSSTLSVSTSDSNGESDLDVLTLTVTSINDAPVNVVPTALQAATEDVPKTFSTISIIDVDVGSGLLQVALSADNGTLITLGTPSGLLFSDGDGTADATMTFTGTLPAINTALNALSITAPSNFLGATSLNIVTSDQGNTGTGGASQDSDTINLNWASVNDPPVNSVPGAQLTSEDTPLIFSSAGAALGVSDADIGGGFMRVTFSATNGTVTLGNPGLVTFTAGDGTADTTMTFSGTLVAVNGALDGASYMPNLNFVGTGSVTMLSNDQGNTGGAAASDTDVLSIVVAAVNDPPVNSVPLAQNTNEDVQRVFSSGNGNAITVADPDASALQITLSALNGTLTLGGLGGLTFQAGDGTADASMTATGTIASLNTALNNLRFIPTPNFNGSGGVTIQTNDLGATGLGGARIDEDTVDINVASINDAPDAVNDVVTLLEDEPATPIAVLANDTDAPDSGETLTVTISSAPTHGSASTDGTSITYQPAANYNGADSITYAISDGHGGSDSATVAITVTAANDPPDAVDDAISVAEVTVAAGAPSQVINPLTNDTSAPDGVETLTIVSITAPAHGSAVIAVSNTSLSYTPAFAYNGPDSFTYTISDGHGGTDTAQIAIDVTSVDTQPAPAADTLAVDEDSANNPVDVLANDLGLTDGPFAVEILTAPLHGTASVQLDNSVLYTPAGDYEGQDTLIYRVTDADDDNATATLTITVRPLGDLPDAVPDSVETDEDTELAIAVLDNDQKIVDLPVIVTILLEPEHGTATPEDDGTVSYVPDENYNGDDAFTYTVTDRDGSTSTAAVSIAIHAVNDAPDAMADSAATDADTSSEITVLANDVDVDGDLIHIESVTASALGGITVLNANGTIRYTPPDGAANVNDSFSYTIADVSGATDTTTVVVAVGLDSDDDGILDREEADYGTAVDDADSDDDGIGDGLEVFTTHTDPLDDDSDDDGLLDGSEDEDHDGEIDSGETAPLDPDSDDDGVQDGTELGLRKPEGNDTDAGVFIADADPTSVTDPTAADSDGDGASDGVEDANHDGRVEPGESDPAKGSDHGTSGAADSGAGASDGGAAGTDDSGAAGQSSGMAGRGTAGAASPEQAARDGGAQCADAGTGKDCAPANKPRKFVGPDKSGCSVNASNSNNAQTVLYVVLAALILSARRRRKR